MDEQTGTDRTRAPSKAVLVVAVLLFVGLYVWGFVLSIIEMSQRESSG